MPMRTCPPDRHPSMPIEDCPPDKQRRRRKRVAVRRVPGVVAALDCQPAPPPASDVPSPVRRRTAILVPEVFLTLTDYLPPQDLSSLTAVCSSFAEGVSKALVGREQDAAGELRRHSRGFGRSTGRVRSFLTQRADSVSMLDATLDLHRVALALGAARAAAARVRMRRDPAQRRPAEEALQRATLSVRRAEEALSITLATRRRYGPVPTRRRVRGAECDSCAECGPPDD
eukprot:TRINITY_DN5448_c0_g1_i1.p1 TRINITY_DN5448_c0_g1~~TRINITY_DN5448_c0_g1_i1.p1  ORF type:complete len:229 (+),score=48.33 TRINITY_DN5448_c0_g1_i1:43-729(+)